MKLPDKIFGIGTEEAYKKYLEESGKKKEIVRVEPEQSAEPLQVKAKITLSDYIKVPNTDVLISKEEIHKGLKWQDTHYALADNGLFMPSPTIFMPYFLKVKDAEKGKITLYDGNNNSIPRDEVEDLWKYLTSGHRGGCWTWLDALFVKGSGYSGLDIETDHRVVVNKGNKTLQGKTSPLERCVDEECFVDLDFNKQGLPTRKAINQEYKQGENIYFLKPVNGYVAGFDADSGRAGFDCGGDPPDSDSALGVFACAKGTLRQKIK